MLRTGWLLLLGAVLGCAERDCPRGATPHCCQGGCSGDVFVEGVCVDGDWTCPSQAEGPRLVSKAQCPAEVDAGRFCLGPLPTTDGGP